jgi:endonuclease/exonuclease/phosphatase family metal-dependent hydrolase
MRLLSWNLLHGSGAQADDVARLVEAHNPDVVLMQEVGPRLDTLQVRLGGHYARRQMRNRKHGPAAWSRHKLEDLETVALPRGTRLDFPVPIFRKIADRVALLFRVNGICFANVHLDHGQIANRRQIRHLVAARDGIDVIAGDFNALGSTRVPGFEDVGPRTATHIAKGIVPVRIDRCLTRNMAAIRAEALARGKSDHRPILVDLELMNVSPT